jgi:hypothetical protein
MRVKDHKRRTATGEVVQVQGYDRAANFVAPYAPGEARGEIVRYEPALPAEALPPAAQTRAEVSGSHVDRARGFQIASVPLALGVGVGSLILGIVGWQVPVLSVAHNLFSADGIGLVHTLMGWQYLKAEQRERHRRYRDRGQP